jgi:hypothetical protein
MFVIYCPYFLTFLVPFPSTWSLYQCATPLGIDVGAIGGGSSGVLAATVEVSLDGKTWTSNKHTFNFFLW